MELLEDVVSWDPEGELNVSIRTQGLYILNYNVTYPRMENGKMLLECLEGEGLIEIDESDVKATESYETDEENGYRITMNNDNIVEIFTLKGVEDNE